MEQDVSNKRQFTGLLHWIVRGLAFTFGAFTILSCGFGPLPYMEQNAVFVFFVLSIVLINFMAVKGRKPGTRVPWWDVLLIGITVAAVVNILINWEGYFRTIVALSPYEWFLGIAIALIVLEATRRAMGWVMPVLTIAAFAFIYIGPFLPAPWSVRHMPLENVIISQCIIDQGVWGTITGLAATIIGIFIVFGSILLVSGGGKTFIDIALILAGRIRGGPALVAVVASAMFGTVSGSGVANVAATGNFTIPLMKSLGYRPEFAAGVESSASMGGAFTPPIMASATFIMAELLGVSYLKIIIAAIFPAFLFYSAMFFSILIEARKRGLQPVPKDQIASARSVITWPRLGPLIIPIVILLWLLVEGFAIYRAGFGAIATSLLLYLFATSTDFSWTAVKRRLVTVFNAVEAGGRALADLGCLLICASLLIGLINYSGLGVKISAVVMTLAGENLLGALILGAVVNIILGMGLPATPAYIIVVSVVGIGFIRLGLDPLAMHFFCFFFGVLAHITPPNCPNCFVAAAIARTDWRRTAFEAMRLGIIAFIIPFTFVYNPVYLMRGEPIDIIIGVVLGLLGCFFLALGGFGYLRSAINVPSRLLFFAGGFMLFLPDIKTDIIGALCVAGGILFMIALQLIKKTNREVK